MNWLIFGGGTALAVVILYNLIRGTDAGERFDVSSTGGINEEWPVLAKSPRLGELELLKTRLDSENVEVILEAEHCGGYGTLPIFVHRLRVPPDQFNVARGILKESDFGKKHVP